MGEGEMSDPSPPTKKKAWTCLKTRTIIMQGSKGIRQLALNGCTVYTLYDDLQNYLFCRSQLLVETFEHST